MRPRDLVITGFAAVSAGGVLRNLDATPDAPPLQVISRWPTPGPRRAFVVAPVQPADIVPGLRTRRMDRLSAWAMLASALAVQDAGIDPASADGDRHAVVFGTALGCLDLAAEFFGTFRSVPWTADPILFPETLGNQPGSHVAKHFGFRGPNLTVAAGNVSGEAALCQAAGFLRTGQADCAVVLAGDTLIQSLFEWYEASGRLHPSCLGLGEADPVPAAAAESLVPGEGMAACILETAESAARRGARVRASYLDGWFGPGTSAMGGAEPAAAMPDAVARLLEAVPPGTAVTAAVAGGAGWFEGAPGRRLGRLNPIDFGVFGGMGLLNLGAAITRAPSAGSVVLAGTVEPEGQAGALLVRTGDTAR